jgi:ABC-type sugar transport system ATPase subunit
VTHDQIEAMSLSTRLALMNQGRIEQIGAPQDVYEHPQTPFVEDFLGRILRFTGTIVQQEGGFQLVEFDGVKNVRLRIPEVADASGVGKKVLVAIRPEDVKFEKDGVEKHSNVIPCDLENVIHLGREYELVLRVGERLCTITVPREKGIELGRAVGLRLPLEHLRVWAADAEFATSDIEAIA